MEMQLEHFDDTTLAKIFSNLEPLDLLNLCKTCAQFNQIISSSKSLMKRINFTLKLNDNTEKVTLSINHITRRYQNLNIVNLKEQLIGNKKSLRKQLDSLISTLSSSVTRLNLQDCYLSRTEIIALLKKFPNLIELYLQNVMLNDDDDDDDTIGSDPESLPFPNLINFRLCNSDFFCFLLVQTQENLASLEISSALYTRTDVEILENFLLRQRRLKSLKLSAFRFNSTYSTSRLNQVTFQLETLALDDVSWDIAEHCKQFLLSQTSLRQFKLRSFQRWITPREEMSLWFNNIMKHVLVDNQRLESVAINELVTYSYLKNSEFLVGEANKNVKSLQYVRCRTSQSEFINISARLFPNVETITIALHQESPEDILAALSNFPHLKNLSIKSNTTALSQLSEELMARLTSFEFVCIDEVKAGDQLKRILGYNSQIEHLSLNVEPLTFEQITELIMSFASCLKSLSMHNFYLNATEAEMLMKNFPKLKVISSDTSPKPEIKQILSHITFKSINVDS